VVGSEASHRVQLRCCSCHEGRKEEGKGGREPQKNKGSCTRRGAIFSPDNNFEEYLQVSWRRKDALIGQR